MGIKVGVPVIVTLVDVTPGPAGLLQELSKASSIRGAPTARIGAHLGMFTSPTRIHPSALPHVRYSPHIRTCLKRSPLLLMK